MGSIGDVSVWNTTLIRLEISFNTNRGYSMLVVHQPSTSSTDLWLLQHLNNHGSWVASFRMIGSSQLTNAATLWVLLVKGNFYWIITTERILIFLTRTSFQKSTKLFVRKLCHTVHSVHLRILMQSFVIRNICKCMCKFHTALVRAFL